MDAPSEADLLILLGNGLPETARVAAEAWQSGFVPQILISGGLGHSTTYLRKAVKVHPEFGDVPVEGRPEAEIFRDILVRHLGVDPQAILIESGSTNCGANAWQSKRILSTLPTMPRRVVLVQDPTMQRRTHATFERAYRGEDSPDFLSFAPFVPSLTEELEWESGSPDGLWPVERFISLVLGEIPRLRDDESGYGPKGRDFIERVEIPEEVESAFAAVGIAGIPRPV